jgi:hypothetical protein
MKKSILFSSFVLFLGVLANAQEWQGTIIHNGFHCYYLGSERNPFVIAAKGIQWGTEMVYIKIKSPLNLGNTDTAWAKVDESSGIAYNYHNGWIYMMFTNSNYKYITVYPDIYMREGGKTVTLDLQNLNMSQMYINDHQVFDLWW